MGTNGPTAPNPLLQWSWDRSLEHLSTPENSAPRIVLDRSDVREAQAPLRSLIPVLDELLAPLAEDTGLVLALTDARGVLVRVKGSTATRRSAETMGFTEGADWSEAAVGTNAPGTALVLKRLVTVHREQHFYPEARPWSCSAAPLLHPHTGRLLGAVDLTGGPTAAAPAVRALLTAAVRAARAELALTPGAEREPPAAPVDTGVRPLLHVLGQNPPSLTQGEERLLLTARHAELLLLLSHVRAGLSAGELTEQLWGGRARETTVRAEILRLRRLLAPYGMHIASRPYRLAAPLASDAGQVLELLSRGSHRRALQSYGGALLPSSEAPAVIELRHRLSALLREAVLTDGSVKAIRHYLALPEAASDTGAWEQLLRLLPLRSHVRAHAVVELERLRA